MTSSSWLLPGRSNRSVECREIGVANKQTESAVARHIQISNLLRRPKPASYNVKSSFYTRDHATELE